MEDISLKWKVDTTSILQKCVELNGGAILSQPLQILQSILAEVAIRAIELDDKGLNKLMLRLSLYSIADPKSNDFDQNAVSKYLDS